MIATKLFIIGNATVPSTWVALITAFVVAYLAVRLKFGKRIAGMLADSIFYFILVWKLSVMLTDFQIVIKSPLSIIYFNGGQTGFYLGLVAAMATIFIESIKRNLHTIDYKALLLGFITIQSSYQVMMVVLNEGQFIAQIVTVFMFTLFVLLAYSIEKVSDSLFQLAILFVAVHFFTASFQPIGIVGTSVIASFVCSLFFIIILRYNQKFESEGQS